MLSQAYHAVRVADQPLETQHRVVGLYDDVADLLEIWEHPVGLDELLWKVVVQALEEKGA